MTMTSSLHQVAPVAGVNRVPRITIEFWLIKLMAVTMGETAADYISVQLGLGLTTTSIVMTAVLAAALVWQFLQRRYVPAPYWLAVVLISAVGTLFTDNLVDNLHVRLLVTTVAFAILLAATFAAWWTSERTLSIHAVYTTRREALYWLAILFTFALGTAAGDLVAEQFSLGYLATGILFGMIIASLSIAISSSSSTRSLASGTPADLGNRYAIGALLQNERLLRVRKLRCLHRSPLPPTPSG